MSRQNAKGKWLERDVWHLYAEAEDDAPGVYVILAAGEAVYVGASNRIRQRLRQHGLRNHPEGTTLTPWAAFRWETHLVTVKVKYAKRYGAHLMLEARLIRRLQPMFNVRGRA